MAENSKIEWTTHTFNPWRGCQKVSAGCANCYAEQLSGRNPKTLGTWGSAAQGGQRIVAAKGYWAQPFAWDKAAQRAGRRDRVFCASLADVFEDWPGPLHDHFGEELNCIDGPTYRPLTLQDVRERLFDLIDATPNLDWLLLTKRPENIRAMWPQPSPPCLRASVPSCLTTPNVWLLTSIEDQAAADQRIPELLKCRDLAPVLGLSCEPLIGPVDLREFTGDFPSPGGVESARRWVIAGGESGPGARPMHPDWARSLRDQCEAAGVPFFFKQWGEWLPYLPDAQPPFWCGQDGRLIDGHSLPERITDGAIIDNWWCPDLLEDSIYRRVGKSRAGRLLDGREHSEFPSFPSSILHPPPSS